jgi:hypothetical protein
MSRQATARQLDTELGRFSDDSASFEDSSPFGLQGLAKKKIRIIKPESITRFAVNLALCATRKQIQDPKFVSGHLKSHPEWYDEYRIVHLIEKSLWIQGRSDLVMTLTRNPKRIPDNPPPKVKRALFEARMYHRDATIWYGVPLFGDEKNVDGLPIPVTADEVCLEARRRIEAAQKLALRWLWCFRIFMVFTTIAVSCWQFGLAVKRRIQSICHGIAQYWKRSREDSRRRDRARFTAEWEYSRYGYATTMVPEHRTWLGKSLEASRVIFALTVFDTSVVGAASSFVGAAAGPLIIAKFVPLLFVPIVVVSCDPFLFVELPEEPGKLRHIGHWYWQKRDGERDKLHLHV